MDYDYYGKKSGQIPTFGDWDYSNQMPITQYFECARQAGLIRYSSSSGDSSEPYIHNNGAGDLYAVDLKYPPRRTINTNRKTRMEKRGGSNVKEQRKQGKVFDVTDPPRKQQHLSRFDLQNNNNKINNNTNNKNKIKNPPPPSPPPRHRPPKAVDEDLYKIPPELLHSSKRKKRPSFFACLVPACAT